MLDRLKFIPVNDPLMKVRMERFDISIVFRHAYVRELPKDALVLQLSPDRLCDELGSVDIADGDAPGSVLH